MKKKHHNSTRQSITSRHQTKVQRHRTEVSAGGLVFKRTPSGVYVAMLKDSFGNWTFPKGHIQKGESYIRGAAREICEETGLKKVRQVRKLGQIDIWFRDRFVFKGKLVHKYIHYFLFEAVGDTRLKKPEQKAKGERIRAVKWIPAHLVQKRSQYRDMKAIIKKALDHLKIRN